MMGSTEGAGGGVAGGGVTARAIPGVKDVGLVMQDRVRNRSHTVILGED